MNNHQNTTDAVEYGGISFFLQNLAHYLSYLTLVTVGDVLGTFSNWSFQLASRIYTLNRFLFLKYKGNLVVIFSIFCTKNLHNATNFFILNLALSDLAICFFSQTFNIVGNY
jgi:hypothetical protein